MIIGGGMCGLVAWFALQHGGIAQRPHPRPQPRGPRRPVADLCADGDAALAQAAHRARPSATARSTFQAWYRAQFGAAAWEALDKIPRPMWMDYLRWYRKVLDIPVENGVSRRPRRAGGRPAAAATVRRRTEASILTRKLSWPPAATAPATEHPRLRRRPAAQLWAHSSDDIDFARPEGRRVAVIGVGASAVDNAAEALEAGAAEVRHLIRRTRCRRSTR